MFCVYSLISISSFSTLIVPFFWLKPTKEIVKNKILLMFSYLLNVKNGFSYSPLPKSPFRIISMNTRKRGNLYCDPITDRQIREHQVTFYFSITSIKTLKPTKGDGLPS